MRGTAMLHIMATCMTVTILSCGDTAVKSGGPVAQNGGVLVVAPNGGETLHIGDTVMVKFGFVCDESEIEGFDFMTELYYNDKLLIQSLDCCSQIELASERERPWVIPDSTWELNESGGFTDRVIPMPQGGTYKIRIREYDQRFPKDDYSDSYFSIAE